MADKKLAMAQAKEMRAYNHFMLVNTFAKTYVKETAVTDNGLLFIKNLIWRMKSKQYSVQEVYDFIMEDLNAAIPDLPEKPLNEFRPSFIWLGLAQKKHICIKENWILLKCWIEVLKSTYHKLWDMRPMYYDAEAELPFMDFMSTG